MYVHKTKGGNPAKPPIGGTHRRDILVQMTLGVPRLLQLLSFPPNTIPAGNKLKLLGCSDAYRI